MVDRKGFIVFFKTPKVINEIENIANVTYISKKKKYLIAYCDSKRYEGYSKQIRQVKGVTSIIESLHDMSDYSFEENVSVK